jgi:hypothetical protein
MLDSLLSLFYTGSSSSQRRELAATRRTSAGAAAQQPEPFRAPPPPPPPPLGGIPLEVADLKIFPHLSAHAAARLQCSGKMLYTHLSDEHDCWNAIVHAGAGAGEDRGERALASAKKRCLKRWQTRCSLCGGHGDIDLELEASCKYACCACTLRHVDLCKLLASHESHIRRKIVKLEIAARRRLLAPVLRAGCLRDMLAAPPAPCPQLLFSTRVDGRAVGTLFASTGAGGVTLKSYTLHPIPYTLHPTPHNLDPTPYTLHPTPYTLHPRPYTLHPTPYTLHRTP